MALTATDVLTTDAQLAPTKMTQVANMVQRELAFNSKLIPTMDNFSQFARKGVKQIDIPKYGSFVVQNRACGTPGDASTIAATVDSILPEFNAYVAFAIDGCDDIESVIDNYQLFGQRAAAAQSRYVDTQAIAKLELHGQASALTGDITYDWILEAQEKFCALGLDMNDLFIAVGCDQYSALQKITEFRNQDIYGPNQAIRSGVIGRISNAEVISHPGVGAQSYYMWHKSGLGYAFWQQPKASEQDCNEFGTDGKRVAIDQRFGIGGMHLGEGSAAATESALICKDGN